jgi:hypothetical protein
MNNLVPPDSTLNLMDGSKALSAMAGMVLNRKAMIGRGTVYTTTGSGNTFYVDLDNIVPLINTGDILAVKFHVVPPFATMVGLTNPDLTPGGGRIYVKTGNNSFEFVADNELTANTVYFLEYSVDKWYVLNHQRTTSFLSTGTASGDLNNVTNVGNYRVTNATNTPTGSTTQT